MNTRRFYIYLALLLALGTLFQVWLASRAGIHGDQYVFLDMALDFHESGVIKPVSKAMSGGGSIPGGFLQLLVGLPLKVWYDYRAPAIVLVAFHLFAGLLAALTVRGAVGEGPALVFTVLWWLSPWRVYHSAFLWEPNYLFLPAAIHLWACCRLSHSKGALASIVLAATLVLTFQIHGSFLYLVVFTAVLLMRRAMKLQWEGVLLGAVIGSLTLVPTAAAFFRGTLASPAPTGSFPGYGLVKVVPLLRGISYWFRLASLDLGRRIRGVVFLDSEWLDTQSAGWLLKWATLLTAALAAASILVVLYASWRWFRGKTPVEGEGAGWLHTYVSSAMISLVIVSALSPVTIQGWHVVIVLPAACLPVTFWIYDAWPGGGKFLRTVVVLFILLRLPEMVLIGLGHPTYRLDRDIASKLQQRQQTLLPESYRK